MEALDVLAQLIGEQLGLSRAGDAYWVVGLPVVILLSLLVRWGWQALTARPPPSPSRPALELEELEGKLRLKEAEVGLLKHSIKEKKKSIEEEKKS